MKGRIAQIFGLLRPFRPGCGKGAEKIIVGVAHPKARFRREPIQAPQPLDGFVQAWIIQNSWLPIRLDPRLIAFPFRTVPMPRALLSIAPRQQTQAHGILHQFESEPRHGPMHDAELFPIHAVGTIGSCATGSTAGGLIC